MSRSADREVFGDVTDLELDLVFLMLLAHSLDNVGRDIDTEVARVAPVYCPREGPVPAARVDDGFDGVRLDEIFKVSTILPCDLQGRSRTARSLSGAVLAPSSLGVDAVEGVYHLRCIATAVLLARGFRGIVPNGVERRATVFIAK